VADCGLTARDVVVINGGDGATAIHYGEDGEEEEELVAAAKSASKSPSRGTKSPVRRR